MYFFLKGEKGSWRFFSDFSITPPTPLTQNTASLGFCMFSGVLSWNVTSVGTN